MEKEKAMIIEHLDGVTYKWYGGHGIHIYKHRKEIEFFNVGDFSKNEATRKEVNTGIKRWHKEHIKELIYPEEINFSEAEEYPISINFENLESAERFAKKIKGVLYTQVDAEKDRVYLRGKNLVNRTGIYLVVRNVR